MQVSVEAGEGLERRMKIDLPFEQLSDEVEKRLQKFARSARLPGFRQGKVPMKLLRQRYSEQLHQEALSDMVQSSFTDALAQQSLQPVGMPQIEPDINLEEARASFTATFEVMPEFELAPITDRVVKRPVGEVVDADLDAMIERLRTQRKTWSPVERACQSGDQVTVSFVGTVDGEAFEGGSAEDLVLELGAGRMIPGFEDGLIGAAVGETRTLDLTFPDPYKATHLAGKPVRFEITLNALSEPCLPELDEALVKEFGVESGDVERFKSDVRANMERELKDRLEARTKERVMDLLLEANSIDVPRALVEQEIQAMTEQMHQALGGAQMQLPPALFTDAARRRVALALILARFVKDNALEVDADRVRETVEKMAATYEDPQAVIDYYYADPSRQSQVENMVLEGQVVALILDQVVVEDEQVSFEEMANPDSTGGQFGV